MKKRILYGLLGLAASATGGAQQNKVSFGLGYQRTWMVDKQASPLKYQSGEKTFALGYSHRGNQSIFLAQLKGAFGDFFPTGFRNRQYYDPGYNPDGTPKRDSNALTGTLYNGAISATYLRKINSGFSQFGKNRLEGANYAGLSLANQLFYSDNIVRTGWMNSSSLDAVYHHSGAWNGKHQFGITITVPLLVRNTRLPYHNSVSSSDGAGDIAILFKQGSRITSVFSFQDIKLDAGVDYALSRRFGVGLHYSGQWLRYRYEQPVTLFQNNIFISAFLQSKK